MFTPPRLYMSELFTWEHVLKEVIVLNPAPICQTCRAIHSIVCVRGASQHDAYHLLLARHHAIPCIQGIVHNYLQTKQNEGMCFVFSFAVSICLVLVSVPTSLRAFFPAQRGEVSIGVG